MRTGNAALLAVFAVLGLGAVRGASADDVVVLQDLGSGLLSRSDAPAAPPNTIVGVSVTGLEENEKILAIDTRPGMRMLFGVTSKRLYAIDLDTGVATAVGPRFQHAGPEPWRAVSFDIRPATDTGFLVQSVFGPGAHGAFVDMRTQSISIDTGEADEAHASPSADSSSFAYVEGDPAFGEPAQIQSVAFAGSIGGAAAWTTFGIDAKRGTLVRIGSPGGLLVPGDDGRAVTTIATLSGLPAGAVPTALEIGEDGPGLLLVQGAPTKYTSGVYRIDLATGESTLMRDNGGETFALDIAVLPKFAPNAPEALSVDGAVVRYTFSPARHPGTSVEISGSIPMPRGGVAGGRAVFDIDGVVREFPLDARGRGKSGADRLKMTARLDGTARFTLAIRRSQSVEIGGVELRTTSRPIQVLVDLFVAGHAHRGLMDLDYVIAPRSRGTAKLARD